MKTFILSLALISSIVYAGSEEQRKYLFSDWNPTLDKLLVQKASSGGGGEMGGFIVYPHSSFTYVDIYLDSEDLWLLKSGYSLRLRQRTLDDGSVEYGFQLKSEMLKAHDIRTEIDDNELGYYQFRKERVSTHFERLLSRAKLLTEKFTRPATDLPQGQLWLDPTIAEECEYLSAWFEYKWGGASEPLQELRYLLKQAGKKSLRLLPMMVGESLRARSHILVNRETTSQATLKVLPDSQVPVSGIPKTMPVSTAIVWVSEASMDNARFFPLRALEGPVEPVQMHRIREFEVENKYLPSARGSELLNLFEADLMASFKTGTELASKYRQSMRGFLGELP